MRFLINCKSKYCILFLIILLLSINEKKSFTQLESSGTLYGNFLKSAQDIPVINIDTVGIHSFEEDSKNIQTVNDFKVLKIAKKISVNINILCTMI